MIPDEVLHFIREQRSLGKSKEAIDAALKSGGWNDQDLKEAWEALGRLDMGYVAGGKHGNKRWVKVIAAVLVVAAAAAGVWFAYSNSKVQGSRIPSIQEIFERLQ